MTIGVGHLWTWLVLILVVAGIVAIVRRSGRRRSRSITADKRECPTCKEWMRRDASVCPHCRMASEPWTFHDGRWWVIRPDATYYLDERSQTWRRFEP
jgi:predicted amidophosphoribosyltransferase